MIFDNVMISPDRTPEENLKIVKSWADTLVDSLTMLDNHVRDLENKLKAIESEGE